MRSIPPRHSVAALRAFVGISQKELAEFAGCSTATIQSVETGRLKLSRDLALRISDATGVSENWLLDGDPTRPPVDVQGKSYTVESFDRAMRDQPYSVVPAYLQRTRSERLAETTALLHVAFLQAEKDGRLSLVDKRVRRAIHEVLRSFRDHVPGFFGDPEGYTTVAIEYPTALGDILVGASLLVRKVASENGSGTKKKLADSCGEIASVLRVKAEEYQKLAMELDPGPSTDSEKPQ